jgi:hypothetical protein
VFPRRVVRRNIKQLTRTQKSRSMPIQALRTGLSNYPSPSDLPLRPSLTPSPPQMVPHLEAMTPAQSEHSEANSPASVHDDSAGFSSPKQVYFDSDMEMDEDDFDIIGSQPPDSPFIQTFQTPMRPAKLDPTLFGRDSPANNTGRIPTPIYPSFAGSRGTMGPAGMGALGYPNSGFAGGLSMGMNLSTGHLGVPSNPILQTPPVTRKQPQLDQDRSRRMPSPISEDEDIPDTPTALTQSQLSRLSVTSNNHAADSMDLEIRTSVETDMAPPPGVVTTPTRGRKRSGALSGKGRFSMGYRDDCEKCRQRVPGHYSHFLP